MKKKTLSLISICLVLMLLMTACGASGGFSQASAQQPAAEEQKTEEKSAEEATAAEETTAQEEPAEEAPAQDQEEAAAEEEPSEGSENAREIDPESLDEIVGHYEMRPAEIWKTTADVYEENGNLFMHLVSSSSEDYLHLYDGYVYAYSPEQNARSNDPYFTYTFEGGVISMTNMEETSTIILKKAGAE